MIERIKIGNGQNEQFLFSSKQSEHSMPPKKEDFGTKYFFRQNQQI